MALQYVFYDNFGSLLNLIKTQTRISLIPDTAILDSNMPGHRGYTTALVYTVLYTTTEPSPNMALCYSNDRMILTFLAYIPQLPFSKL